MAGLFRSILRALVIKSIQRGTITVNGAATGTAAITAVDTTKTELRMLGFSHAGATTMNNWAPQSIWPRIDLTNTTTVTATLGADPTVNVIVSFEVTEYWY